MSRDAGTEMEEYKTQSSNKAGTASQPVRARKALNNPYSTTSNASMRLGNGPTDAGDTNRSRIAHDPVISVASGGGHAAAGPRSATASRTAALNCVMTASITKSGAHTKRNNALTCCLIVKHRNYDVIASAKLVAIAEYSDTTPRIMIGGGESASADRHPGQAVQAKQATAHDLHARTRATAQRSYFFTARGFSTSARATFAFDTSFDGTATGFGAALGTASHEVTISVLHGRTASFASLLTAALIAVDAAAAS